jgi:hypothetical protein
MSEPGQPGHDVNDSIIEDNLDPSALHQHPHSGDHGDFEVEFETADVLPGVAHERKPMFWSIKRISACVLGLSILGGGGFAGYQHFFQAPAFPAELSIPTKDLNANPFAPVASGQPVARAQGADVNNGLPQQMPAIPAGSLPAIPDPASPSLATQGASAIQPNVADKSGIIALQGNSAESAAPTVTTAPAMTANAQLADAKAPPQNQAATKPASPPPQQLKTDANAAARSEPKKVAPTQAEDEAKESRHTKAAPERKKEMPDTSSTEVEQPPKKHRQSKKPDPILADVPAPSDEGVKQLIVASPERLGVTGMTKDHITTSLNGVQNTYRVGDNLPSGERIQHIDAGANVVVTDRSIIRFK